MFCFFLCDFFRKASALGTPHRINLPVRPVNPRSVLLVVGTCERRLFFVMKSQNKKKTFCHKRAPCTPALCMPSDRVIDYAFRTRNGPPGIIARERTLTEPRSGRHSKDRIVLSEEEEDEGS